MDEDHIVFINEELLDYKKLNKYIKDRIQDNKIYYLFLDEVQNVDNFEKVVYNELINRNYEVYIGKTKNGEVDFLARKDGNIKYIQVTYEMKDNDSTIEREFAAYKFIEDNFPKYVVSLDKIDLSRDDIIHLNLIDFLLCKEF